LAASIAIFGSTNIKKLKQIVDNFIKYRLLIMIAKITNSIITRYSTSDYKSEYNSDGLYKIRFHHIQVRYDFISKNGYAGYIQSPKFSINFFKPGLIKHEYLDSEEANIWFKIIDIRPFMRYQVDEDGDYIYPCKSNEKYFYQMRFKKDSWIKISFNDIAIKQIAPTDVSDYFNTKSFLIHLWKVYDIEPIEFNHPPKTITQYDDLPF